MPLRPYRTAVQERLQGLFADSRPVEEIGASLAAELQEGFLDAADRGTQAEAQLRQALPSTVVDLLPPLPAGSSGMDASDAEIDVTPGGSGRATFSPGPPRSMPREQFTGGQAANRLGSELSRLSAEVESVREAVAEYSSSGGSSMMVRFGTMISLLDSSADKTSWNPHPPSSPVPPVFPVPKAVSIREQRDRLQAHLREIDAAAASLSVEGREDLQWAEAIEETRLLAAELAALKL